MGIAWRHAGERARVAVGIVPSGFTPRRGFSQLGTLGGDVCSKSQP